MSPPEPAPVSDERQWEERKLRALIVELVIAQAHVDGAIFTNKYRPDLPIPEAIAHAQIRRDAAAENVLREALAQRRAGREEAAAEADRQGQCVADTNADRYWQSVRIARAIRALGDPA
jgi:transcriptional regulator with AAA-type ATPase domain